MILKRFFENIQQRQKRSTAATQIPASIPTPGSLVFRCNICGQPSVVHMSQLQRESRSCQACGSTLRWRAIVDLLAYELFGRSIALPDFPLRPDITGLGMSDWEGYAVPLAEKLAYQNTFYHQQPLLDITKLDATRTETCDFVISSDVFEHIAPPIAPAFQNVWRLLRPGGIFIFSVPYQNEGMTLEHFPGLNEYTIEQTSSGYQLRNRTGDGTVEIFENLVFHDGPGATLEMRLFSARSLIDELHNAGFVTIKFHQEPNFLHGIYWHEHLNLPITARRGQLRHEE